MSGASTSYPINNVWPNSHDDHDEQPYKSMTGSRNYYKADMLKRDENGQEWIVRRLKISTNGVPMKGSAKVYVDDIYCGQY